MTHVVMVNDEADSSREGMEESVPVTVVEVPPMRAVALRAYEETPYGQKPVSEVWATEFHDELDRALDLPAEDTFEADSEALRNELDAGNIDDLRLITHTVPDESPNVPKKKPDIMETRVGGGALSERADFGLELLDDGGEHSVDDVFRAGEYLDVSGSRKGKAPKAPSSGGASRNGRANTPARAGDAGSATSVRGTHPASVRRCHSKDRPATSSEPSSTNA